MQRGGPRGTIPPTSERHGAGRRWALQLLAGVGVVGAVFFGLRLLHNEPDAAQNASDSTTGPRVDAAKLRDLAAPANAPSAPHPTATSLDLEAFVGRLQRVRSYAVLGDISVPEGIRVSVAELRIAQAAAALEERARANDRDANVALSRLELACRGEHPDTTRSFDAANAEAAERATKMPAETRERIKASIAARRERFTRMSEACAEARFDSPTISQRLREAAAAGHEASLWQLGNLADIETARRYWLSAAMLGFGPAQVDLAQNLMYHPTSKDADARAQMQYWLQAAAKQSWAGKVTLGECLIAGCSGQPPDTAGAAQQLREAVFLGAASAPEALASIPADDPAAPTDLEIYTYESFLQRLNELGCYGADQYPSNALRINDHLRQLALSLSPSALADAQTLADQAWRDHGVQARAAWHCE